jgi:hypothetical protein
MSEAIKIGNSEVLTDGDGAVDEIVIRDSKGQCLFHLEFMHDNTVWAAVYAADTPGERCVVGLQARGKIKATHRMERI